MTLPRFCWRQSLPWFVLRVTLRRAGDLQRAVKGIVLAASAAVRAGHELRRSDVAFFW
jgi:hypothetical protein